MNISRNTHICFGIKLMEMSFLNNNKHTDDIYITHSLSGMFCKCHIQVTENKRHTKIKKKTD